MIKLRLASYSECCLAGSTMWLALRNVPHSSADHLIATHPIMSYYHYLLVLCSNVFLVSNATVSIIFIFSSGIVGNAMRTELIEIPTI